MQYVVAVRALCEFAARHGDLDLRFTPAHSAQDGIAGHTLVASRRSGNYQAEVGLEGDYKTLKVRGRADGYDPDKNLLEEVKTYRGDLHSIPDNRRNLHWAQAKIYGWLICKERNLQDINLSLVYFDVASLQETPLTEHYTAASLGEYFELLCEAFLLWAGQEMAHRLARDGELTSLGFPHETFRPGQRELAEAVYKTVTAGKCLMAQATTGIGKTMATVFPMLKATPKQRLDKVFFLAAKTPGRKLALDAFQRIRESAPGKGKEMPLRVLELVARDKSCEHPDKACHGDSCPLAKGFYDRLPGARSAAVAFAKEQTLDRAALREVALTHRVCPYYLSQDLVNWSDVVIGDYNYYFDTSALLHAMTTANQWRVAVLVDEAHNMIERARKMYSATLSQAQLQEVHASAPRAVKATLERLNRNFNELHRTQTEQWLVHEELPADFLKSLQQTITTVTDFLVANPTRVDGDLQAFYFEALHFSRMADTFAAHSMFDITLDDESQAESGIFSGRHGCATLNIRNVVPAPFLAPRFAAARSITLFSATLSPQNFYRDTLGLPDSTAWMDVQSPFSHEQLLVSAVSNISTRYQHRDYSLTRIADLMARQYSSAPGNYLAFLSSYDYLQKLRGVFTQRHPDITVWEQTRQMDEAGREKFLQRFTPASEGIGFAVLGGAFAEGVDLPGRRLIGAFIATLGLPQVNAVNEEIRKRMGAWFDKDGKSNEDGATVNQGYNYTYLYPGIQKVVQAAGRVIRTQLDKGVIYLMDDRFTQAEVQALLPAWWQVRRLHAPAPATGTSAK
ncbi:MAG: ATP-dependent DNA helicase [Pseudomonadota bacterium]